MLGPLAHKGASGAAPSPGCLHSHRRKVPPYRPAQLLGLHFLFLCSPPSCTAGRHLRQRSIKMQRVNDREVQREGGGTKGPKKEVCGAHQVGNVDPGLFAHGERGQESLSSHLKTRIKKGVPHGVPNTGLPPIYTRFPATQGVVPERVLVTVTGRAKERGVLERGRPKRNRKKTCASAA